MAYNGAGTFLINSAGQPVVAGTTISETVFNALTADLATGLSTAITKNGQTTPTANIPMGGFKITGLAAGTVAGDALRFEQLASYTYTATMANKARTIPAIMADEVWLSNFVGCDPTYATFSDDAMTSALALISTNSDYRGATIRIPAGRYKFSIGYALSVYNQLTNIYFEGDGPNNTVLDFSGCAAGVDGFSFGAGAHGGVRNMTITGATRYGISVNPAHTPGAGPYAQQLDFSNLRIQQCGSDGMLLKDCFLVDIDNVWSTANGGMGINIAGFCTTINARRSYCSLNTAAQGWGINGLISGSFLGCGSDYNKWGVTLANTVTTTINMYCEANTREAFNVNTSTASHGSLPSGCYDIHAVTLLNCYSRNNNAGGPPGTYAGFLSIATANNLAADMIIDGCTDTPTAGGDVSISINGTSGTATLTQRGCSLTAINVYTGTTSIRRENSAGTIAQEIVATNGGTFAITDGTTQVILVPAALIAGCTLTMPANPAPGDTIRFASTQTVTTLTVTGVAAAPTTIGVGLGFTLVYSAVAAAWRRV